MITDDGRGIARALAARLERHGAIPVMLRQAGSSPGGNSPGDIPIDLAAENEIRAAIAALRERLGPVGGVVHLSPCDGGPPPEASAGWRRRVQRDLKSLYGLARETGADLAERGRSGGAVFLAVTGMGGAYDPSNGAPATHAGIAAAVTTLAAEWPEVRCKVVDVDPGAPAEDLAECLGRELAAGDETVRVGWVGKRRVTIRFRERREAEPVGGGRVTPDADWVFLLTGGARGITARIGLMLARRYRPTLVLVGRTEAPAAEEEPSTVGLSGAAELKGAIAAVLRERGAGPVGPREVERAYGRLLREREVRENLAAMAAAGARVEYHALDVRDEVALAGLVEAIYRRHGRLDGVVHGAGVIEDKRVRDKTPDSFDRVVHTKVDAAFVLSRVLRFESLKRLAFMSSVTAVFGNPGQFDYAAANGTLNALATDLARRWPGKIVALDWGPWDDTGMVSDGVREQFLRRGVRPIPVAAGIAAFRREIERPDGAPIVVYGDGPWRDGDLDRPGARA